MSDTTAYPLLFTFKELLSSKGFLAGVMGTGRALMVREDDGAWWMYGVEPGGLAESGDTPQEAHLKFVETFKGALSDIASESTGFGDFERKVQKFFHEVSTPDADLWEERAAAIREGTLVPESPFSALPKQPAASPRYISVQELEAAASFPAAVSSHQPALPTAA